MLFPWERAQVIDTRTGEIVTETSNPDAGIYLGKRKRHPGGFVIVYESEFRESALMLKDYGAITLCLWNILFTKVEIGTGEIIVNTEELAELLHTHRPNISRSLKTILELKLIKQVRKEGKHFVYQINPRVMWKGRESERQDILRAIDGGKSKKKVGDTAKTPVAKRATKKSQAQKPKANTFKSKMQPMF